MSRNCRGSDFIVAPRVTKREEPYVSARRGHSVTAYIYFGGQAPHTQYAKLKHYVGKTGRKSCCNKDCVKLENEANSSDTLTNQSVIDDFLTPAVTHGKYHYCL